MKRLWIVIGAIACLWLLTRALPNKSPTTEAPPAPAVDLDPVANRANINDRQVAQVQAESPAPRAGLDESKPNEELLDEAKLAARSAEYFAALPAEDQAWVLREATASVARGQVEKNDLTLHIQELSSMRQFAVLEREEPMVAEPQMPTIDENGNEVPQ